MLLIPAIDLKEGKCVRLRQGRMDELRLYSAPKVVGDPAAPGLFTGLAPETMDQAIALRLSEVGRLGQDARLVFRPLLPGEVPGPAC